MLSCGLGYAYERSGSLLRPILMHIFFNSFSVVMTLLMPQ
jgi:membrane protease YdiL (CAAX protease family)